MIAMNERIENRMEENKDIAKEVSRDRLIARIQCFEDEMRQWYRQLLEPEKGVVAEDDEMSKVYKEGSLNILNDVLDSYEDLFGDLTVCKYDGKGF